MHIAIIGAGPVGLEAAAAALTHGHTATVYEAGEVGAGVRRWAHVPMFTPWSMATTATGRDRAGLKGVSPDVCPTGGELVERYLLPLAATLDVRPHHRVLQVGRHRLRKGDALGAARRTEERFRLLLRSPEGERVDTADAVFDCSGVLDDPAPAGPGGLPVPGEADAAARGLLHDGLVDPIAVAGEHVLLVGDGASAVTALRGLLARDGASRVTWLTAAPEGPGFASPDDDPLPERAALHAFGAAAPSDPRVDHRPGRVLDRLAPHGDALLAALDDGSSVEVDAVVAATGFRPDHRLSRELQVHVCWGSEGPMKLAASLLTSSGAGGGDCLAAPDAGPEVLRSPEPSFFVLGHKSYGRRSDFLLTRGHAQVRDAIALLES